MSSGQKTTWKRLITYVTPYKWVLLVALLGVALDSAMQAAFALMMEPVLDGVFIEQNARLVVMMPFVIVGIFLFRALGNYIGAYGFTWVGRNVVNDLRSEVFKQYLNLPHTFYDRHSAGSLISRMTYDIEQMAMGVSKNVVIVVRDLLTIVLFIGVMFYHSAKLTVIVLAVLPVAALIISAVNKRFRRIGLGIQDSISGVSEIVDEVIRGHKVVKVYDGKRDEEARLAKRNVQNRHLHVKNVSTQALSTGFIQLMVAVALGFIIFLAVKENMSPGKFMSFMGAMLGLLPQVKRVSGVFATIQTTLAAADSVFYILDKPAEQDSGQEVLNAEQIGLEFEHVSLAYDADSEAVKDLSLKVQPGQVVALVGQSGSGKTSLVNLVPRFYEVSNGRIRINGTDVREYTLASLRQHIAIVSQDVVLFNDTVTKNIAYGANCDKTAEQVMAAARKANAHEFIMELPQGYDTLLGDNGTRLSGGQRQRIAIARAILKDAPLLILDEATSALDSESEKHIQNALDEVMKGKTTLVIAHRLSTIEHADEVVVMAKGEIVEQGTHAALMALGGVYHQLQHMQHSTG